MQERKRDSKGQRRWPSTHWSSMEYINLTVDNEICLRGRGLLAATIVQNLT